MNIAFFCDSYKPTHNGVAVSVETTACHLRSKGHRVVIFAPRYPDYDEPETDVIRFPATPFFRVRDFPVAWPILPYFSLPAWSYFLKGEFDIVHSHSPFILGTVGARWARYSHLPLVFTFHTLYHRYIHYSPFPDQVSRPYTLEKVRRYCSYCDQIIAPSHAIARVVNRFRSDVPTTVIPTGVDLVRFASGDGARCRARLGIAPDEKILLYVGRIAAEKNLEFLLRALSPLLKPTAHGPKTRLLFVGGGPALPELKEIARELQIEDRVLFTGFLEETDLVDSYAAGDVFVFASRTETQGVCIAEALAAGLPCVVVGAMGAAEAVTDGVDGYVVPARDDRFYEAVKTLLENDELREGMARAAQAKASSVSRETRVGELLKTYESLTQSRPRL